MPTKFSFNTCHCIIMIPDNAKNDDRVTFASQCITHDTVKDALIHNRSFSSRTLQEKDIEKRKQKFQRRS